MPLVAGQVKLSIAIAVTSFACVTDQVPGAAIPEYYRSRTVLFIRGVPREGATGNRMVLDLSQAFFFGIKTWPFLHRPAFPRPVQFQTKIVVQMAGPMLLDDKALPNYTDCAAIYWFWCP